MLSGSPAAEFILNGLLETIFNKDDIIFRNISVYDILWGKAKWNCRMISTEVSGASRIGFG